MKIIIVGAGSTGLQIAQQLTIEKKNVVLIEQNAAAAKQAENSLDCLVINKSGTSLDVLKEAGIESADFFISVTESDEVNMVSCGIVSNEFNVPIKIARIRNPHYSEAKLLASKVMGIDYMVNPEKETANVIVNTIIYGASSEILQFEKTKVQMRSIKVDSNSILYQKTVEKMRQLFKESFLVAGILRDSEFIVPTGKTVIQESDILWVIALGNSIETLFDEIGKLKQNLSKILILGGGQVTNALVVDLLRMGKSIKIIEKDYQKCKQLAASFPQAIIINSDISDERIFDEEQLHLNDLMICTTSNEELNIIAALYAKSVGIKRAICLVAKERYASIALNLGIDSIVNPKRCTVNRILRFIRKGNIKSIHSIFSDQAEVIEFTVEKENDMANMPIKKIKMPKDSIILTVNRKETPLIPDGDFVILPEDNIITIAKKDAITKLERVFLQ